ncbi:MAG: hypothetical protein LBS97_07245 [Treponema sp.]|jgi:hypothetical protein|nr:hypothetical protein [Treponema sp.]
MQKRKKSNLTGLLLGAAVAAAVLLVFSGCPNSAEDGGGGGASPSSSAPEKPGSSGWQEGVGLKDTVDLSTVNDTAVNTLDNRYSVLAFTWQGEGAITYNVYWSEEASRPVTPNVSGLTNNVCFATNLEEKTTYYFWVEAVNPNGTTVSDRVEKTSPSKNVDGVDGGKERGDYPRNIRIVPGDGSLTVSWSLSDRVGWYEVYYAPKGTITHLDIYTPVEFRYDNTKTLASGAVDVSSDYVPGNGGNIAYTGSFLHEGHTRPLYPFCTPLAPNSGYEGYYVRATTGIDGDTRPKLGINDTSMVGKFYKIMEAWDEGLGGGLKPYKALDSALSAAIPWDGTKAGTPGKPVKFYSTTTTITGLTNGTEYEVWIRPPNANGERGYGYISGTPGASSNTLAAPANVQVFSPANTMRDLLVYWNKVPGAVNYRIYTSKFDYTPTAASTYVTVSGEADPVYTVTGLQSNTTYYVWVVAESGGFAGVFGTPAKGKTGAAPAAGKIGDKVIAGTSAKVKTAVYVEVNDRNPLNAGSYILDDGTYLFDYVILFAANIRSRACDGTAADGYCIESGPHVHFNDNVKYILDNKAKYIEPLQAKGIKVLLGLLGDHDGITFGTMTDAERATFVADIKKDVEAFGLDGVDFDDEWGSKEAWDQEVQANNPTPTSIWTYPTSSWGWPFSMTIYRDPTKGIVAGNGTLIAPSAENMDRMWKESGESYYKTIKATRDALGTSKIVSLYEYNTGRYVTPGGAANGSATVDLLKGAIDFAMQPWYNQYIADSANGLPRSIYSPFGMDLSGKAYSAQNGAPNPPIVVSNNAQATNTIYDYATRFKKAATDGNAYNVLYFYGLEEATNLLKHASADSTARVTKEEYISMMTKIVFNKDTIVTSDGGDYRKDW